MEIYKITNLINGKIYIGKDTKDDNNYYGSGLLIKRSIDKYGLKNFMKEVLEKIDDYKYLSEREKYWIEYFKSNNLDIGYNISSGGDGGDTLSNHPELDKIKSKISLNSKVRGKTYEEAYGEDFAIIYKDKLSKSHPRKKLKDLLGDKYELWLDKIRLSANNKKGKSIKEINNWSDIEYESYIESLRNRFYKTISKLSDEKIKIIHDKNRERAKNKRLKNIEEFISKVKNNGINKNNYKKYQQKIYHWKIDLGDKFSELINEEIMNYFNGFIELYKIENIKKRSINFKNNFNHTDESKIKISKLKEYKFLEYLKEIENKIDSIPDSDDLSDIFNDNTEIKKIRKRLLNSKFKYLIKDKYLKVIESKEFYGNYSKRIKINDDIYNSITEASEKLKIDRSLIRYRLKSNNFKNYIIL
jgi:hypothetical protein